MKNKALKRIFSVAMVAVMLLGMVGCGGNGGGAAFQTNGVEEVVAGFTQCLHHVDGAVIIRVDPAVQPQAHVCVLGVNTLVHDGAVGVYDPHVQGG